MHLRPTNVVGRHTVEGRAPKQFAGDDALTELYRKLDFFPTPPWAARAICEAVRDLDPEATTMSEPACGQGHFAEPAKEYFKHVEASDVHDYGYGAVRDFLFMPRLTPSIDWVITNPPFQLAQEFAETGLRVAWRGVALLTRLSFVATIGRFHLIFGRPADSVIVFCERVGMQLGSWDPDGSTMTEYCAVIWSKNVLRRSPPRLRAFPPGTKERLTRATDASRFGPKRAPIEPMPLFGTTLYETGKL